MVMRCTGRSASSSYATREYPKHHCYLGPNCPAQCNGALPLSTAPLSTANFIFDAPHGDRIVVVNGSIVEHYHAHREKGVQPANRSLVKSNHGAKEDAAREIQRERHKGVKRKGGESEKPAVKP